MLLFAILVKKMQNFLFSVNAFDAVESMPSAHMSRKITPREGHPPRGGGGKGSTPYGG